MRGDIIPDGEYLYKYAKPGSFPEGQEGIPGGIFEIESLSCDWAAHQKKPECSFHIREGKSVIIRISVCDEIRNPCNPRRSRQKMPELAQTIIHDPVEIGEDSSHPDTVNYSHSLIQGKKKALVTSAIARNSIIYKRVTPEEIAKLCVNSKMPIFRMERAIILSLIAIALVVLIIFIWR